MEAVSQKWVEANEDILIDGCFVEVILEISEPTALYTASAPSGSELAGVSDVSEIVSNTHLKKYGTLEKNIWLLNGSTYWAESSDNSPAGYISNAVCDANCSFSSLPIVTISSSTTQNNVYGVTITFSELFDEYATEFELIFRIDNTVVANKIVTGNELTVCPVQLEPEPFNNMEIRIYKWCLPEHRARIENVFMGLMKKFTNNELIDFRIDKSVSPVNATLPEDTLEFSVDRTKTDFELNQDDTLSGYFKQEQKVTARFGIRNNNGETEYISGGIYYLSNWDFKRGSIKGEFTAKSIISFLNMPYSKGVYSANGVSLWQLATDVLTYAASVSPLQFTWKLSGHMRALYSTAPLPTCTCAECLQYIANAAGCTIRVSRDNVIMIMTTTYTGTEREYLIQNNVLFDYPKVELMKQLKNVSCDIHSISLGESETLYKSVYLIDESAEINAKYKQSGEISYTVTPYESAQNINVESAEIYADNAKIEISGSGFVLIQITGKPIVSNPSAYTVAVSESGNEEKIQNPIITNTATAIKACEAAAAWLQNRSQETFSEFRADPRLDAGDFIKYRNENVLISNVKYNFTGMFRGSCTGRIGYHAFIAPEPDEAYDINTKLFPDVNGDGVVDSSDVAIIQLAAANIGAGLPSGLTPTQEILADADRDGLINSNDSGLVQDYVAGVGSGIYEQSPDGWEEFLRKRGII